MHQPVTGKMIYSVSLALMVITVINTVYADASNRCPPGTYYDRVTDRCDSCADICVNARSQGTETECEKQCPDYSLTTPAATTIIPKCPRGQYYDPAISRCDYCSVLCDNSDIQGTEDDCQKKCPQYLNDKHGSDNESAAAEVVAIPVVVTLVAIIMLISLYALLLFCCEQRLPLCLRMERCLPCFFKGYKKPIECTETSTPSDSPQTSMHNVARPEVCTVLLDENEASAFTDMQFHRQCSRDENNT